MSLHLKLKIIGKFWDILEKTASLCRWTHKALKAFEFPAKFSICPKAYNVNKTIMKNPSK
jgi:hypothetical protein